jgi:Domain of unknown function (DUF4190)
MNEPLSNPEAVKTKSTLAKLSLIFSCCSIIFPFGCIAGVICGHLAMKELKQNPELAGRQQAIWGLIIGYTYIIILAAFVLFLILNPHFEL